MQMIMPIRRRRPRTMPAQLAPLFNAPFMGMPAMPTMATDIASTDQGLDLTVELPGFSKDDIQLEVQDGYLTISAQLEQASSEGQPAAEADAAEQPDAAGEPQASEEGCQCGCQKPSWVRRERFFGSTRRSFYVGEDIDEDAITASFENGLLRISVPKKKQPEAEQKKLIAIQG